MTDTKQQEQPTGRRTLVRMLREPEVVELTGLAAITLWNLERAGRFPRRVKLTTRAIAWREDEIAEWLDDRKRAELAASD